MTTIPAIGAHDYKRSVDEAKADCLRIRRYIEMKYGISVREDGTVRRPHPRIVRADRQEAR